MVEFKESDGFDVNVERFLVRMHEIDAELGPILRSIMGELRAANDEATRRAARTKINRMIREKLDQLSTGAEAS